MGEERKLINTKYMKVYYVPGMFGLMIAISTDSYNLTIQIGTLLFVFIF